MDYQDLITIENNTPLTTSYKIADELGIKHRSLMQLIKDHKVRIEKHFGILRFQNAVSGKRGQPEQYAVLIETQANYVLTLSDNTDKSMEVKALFVKAFASAKAEIAKSREKQSQKELPVYFNKQTQDRCRANEELLPEGYWCVETEMVSQALVLQSLQKELHHWCLPSGSGGKAWIRHLRDINHPLLDEDSKAKLWVPNLSYPIKIMVYPYALLSEFRRWLRVEYAEYYDTKYAPSRLKGDDNKRIS